MLCLPGKKMFVTQLFGSRIWNKKSRMSPSKIFVSNKPIIIQVSNKPMYVCMHYTVNTVSLIMTGGQSKFSNLYLLQAFLSSDLLVWVKELYNVNNQKSLEWMPLHTVSIKHRLRTTDCGLGIKHGLGIKCGPRTILVNTELIGSSQGKIRSKDC